MIVGTAGHIDHGKTALIKALTGTDPDRLAEEKARGITIDLGFAYADLGGGTITGFVDVPGHERLLHTMLAGAGGIDFALLVIAANDGIMPQTCEHLAVLDLLGITRGVVALTKIDLVDPQRRTEVTARIRTTLAGTGLGTAPSIPVSAQSGEGIPALRSALAEAESESTVRDHAGLLRFSVDRSFTLPGAGTVVTGMMLSGQVRLDDVVTVSPSGLTARVRGIHAQNRKATEGLAGQRCALNLAGDRVTKDALRRGDIVLPRLFMHPRTGSMRCFACWHRRPRPSEHGFQPGCTATQRRSARGSCRSTARFRPAARALCNWFSIARSR